MSGDAQDLLTLKHKNILKWSAYIDPEVYAWL